MLDNLDQFSSFPDSSQTYAIIPPKSSFSFYQVFFKLSCVLLPIAQNELAPSVLLVSDQLTLVRDPLILKKTEIATIKGR